MATDTTPTVASSDTTQVSTEQVGVWNGTRHDAELAVNQSDGLTQAELTQVVDRAMARVEYVRERPFETQVPVETITRAEYSERTSGGGSETDAQTQYNRWNDQVWKALFIVGEDGSSADAIGATFSGAVGGFYSPQQDRIVLVVSEGEALQISEATLVHELNHAMQDQYHDLTASQLSGQTQDADLAVDGLVEGEANYVEDRFDKRCGDEWDCLSEPSSDGSGPGNLNFGILQTLLQPYQDGPVFVDQVVQEQGWEAVGQLFENPPETTSQVIHRDLDRESREIRFQDTAEAGWETYPNQGVEGADTVGEASMYVMFWYQAYEYDAKTLAESPRAAVQNHVVRSGSFEQDYYERLEYDVAYNYDHPATDGYSNDNLYPYRNDEGDTTQDGYVWVTEWQTEEDAQEFADTYEEMLAAHSGTALESGVVDVADGPFRGAYGINQDTTTVTIAHAPEPAGVFELRPAIQPETDVTGGTASESESQEPNSTETESATTQPSSETPAVSDQTPGFGVTAVVVAVLASALIARRR